MCAALGTQPFVISLWRNGEASLTYALFDCCNCDRVRCVIRELKLVVKDCGLGLAFVAAKLIVRFFHAPWNLNGAIFVLVDNCPGPDLQP